MNIIQKILQSKKHKQEEELKTDCCIYIPNIEDYISTFKNTIKLIYEHKKSITETDANHLLWNLKNFEHFYDKFLNDLKGYKDTYDLVYYDSLNIKINYMENLKKQYRAEFENIYRSFKNVSKGIDFPRRNEILGQMRKVFDFDSSKYYSNDDQFIIMR